VGEAFGVMVVRGPKSAGQIEVATFREDAPYSDGRHPDAVTFSTPEADARRRDFTVNGMFYDPLEDRVIDFVGGQDDLVRGIIRAIGEPRARFAEDKLRLMRAVRFAAAFEFQLDPLTRDAVEDMAGQITVVSVERIAEELRRMLVHASRVRAMILLHETKLLATVLPDFATVDRAGAKTAIGLPAGQTWVTTLEALSVLDEPAFPLALACLVHAFVDAAGSDAICKRLKLSNRDTQRIHWLVANQQVLDGARQMPWPKLQRMLTSDGIDDLLALHEALATANGRDTSGLAHCRELLKLPANELDPPPLLTGDDLIAARVPRGKHYQWLLEAVRDAQLEKRITTKEEALTLVKKCLAERGMAPPTGE
jgi:poly(A) polymerase